MSLFDFFFPEQAQASHLRRLANQQSVARLSSQANDQNNSQRILALEKRAVELERDLGFVSLLLGGILESVESKGVVSREDIHAAMEKLDIMDGFKDGQLDINLLKGRSQA